MIQCAECGTALLKVFDETSRYYGLWCTECGVDYRLHQTVNRIAENYTAWLTE